MTVECPACGSRYEAGARPVGTQIRCRCGTLFPIKAPDEPASTIKCPRCGGPCSLDSPSCEYCNAVLTAIACPRCFGRVFLGSAHCQHCGASLTTPSAATNSASLICPRCAPNATSVLVAHVVDGTLLDECPACGGVWIDTVAFNKLIADRERQAELLKSDTPAVHIGGAPGNPDSPSNFRYLHCPDCNVLMNRQNFGQRSGVIVDVCKPHGTWFDRDELGRIIQFVLAGGLEDAKRRQLEDLNREIEARQAAVDPAPAISIPMYDRWGTHRPGLLGFLLDLFQ